jgi:copper transport protein
MNNLPSRRVWRCWAVVLAAAIAALAAAASPASAHSTLVATEPSRNAVVERAPDRVLLRFDEPVETQLGSIRVYDGAGRRVDADEITRPERRSVAVAIDGELPRGTYTVAWRVISADSDPINGAWVFHVQAPGAQPSGIAAQVLEGTDFAVSAVYLGGRFADFLLLLFCVGGIAALVLALGAASASVRQRLLRVLAGFAVALAVVALLGIVFQGAAAGNLSLGQAFSSDVVSSVAETRFGRLSLVRAAIAVAIAVLALLVLRAGSRMSRPVAAVAILLGLGLVVTPGFSGHASVSGPVALIADAAHVQAAATWVGGLAFVVAALVLSHDDRWRLAAASVPRFSTMAVASVTILVIAGTVNGYLQVRAWRGLWETEYGVLLLVKLGLVLPLLALGAYNNRYAVPRLRAQIASAIERRRFLRYASSELVIMAAIVGVTAGLVNAPPARTEVAMHGPYEQEVQLGPFMSHVTVMPAMPGANEIHLAFEGERPDEVRVSASLPEQRIGPLRHTAKPGAEPGALVVQAANLSPAGEWQLRIEARRGEFDLFTQTVSVPIEEEP